MECKICPFSKYIIDNWIRPAILALPMFSKEKKTLTDALIGKGFEVTDLKRDTFIEIYLELKHRRGHVFVFATTGAGKTRLEEVLIEHDIISIGANVVIIDPKIDDGLLNRTYQSCVKAGRTKDFMLLSTIYPNYSVKINPMSHYYTVDELINNVVASVPAKDEFFYNTAYETTSAIVYVRLYIKKITRDKNPLNLEEISRYSSYKGLQSLLESLKRIKNTDLEKEQYINLLEQILQSPIDYFSKVTSTLRTTLTQMTLGSIGKVIGNTNTNPFIDRLENDEGVVLYVQTPSMLSKKVSDILAKTVLSMLQATIGRRYLKQKPFVKPLSLHIDEASNALYMGCENIFNKSRGANCMITALTQSVADLEVALGKERAKMIINNSNGKMFMRIVDPDDAKKASTYSGLVKKYTNMISTNSIMAREMEDAAVTYDEIMKFQPREFFYTGLEGSFRGKTAPVSDTEIKIMLPKI